MTPTTYKPSTENSLETVPDEFDSKTHQNLDTKVLALPGVCKPDNFHTAGFLLSAIVEHSNGLLDQRYWGAISGYDLVQKHHPELMEMLEAAWMAKAFKDIRNLSL